MPSVDKKYFLFNKGINTEAPLVAWPEGFSIDEQNFDLLPDGSRRRRLGLGPEADGETTATAHTYSGSSSDYTCHVRSFRWTDAAQISGYNLTCTQIGSTIYIWEEPKSGILGTHTFEIDMQDHAAAAYDPVTSSTYGASTADVQAQQCDFAQINGKLVIVGPYTEPILVSVVDSGGTKTLDIDQIVLKERDLLGVDDGVALTVEPTALTNSHEYNLYNRGWTASNIDAYHTAKARYPAKNMIQYIGMRRQINASYADLDGVKIFSPDKLVAELFQNMSAPQGHAIRDVFNRRNGFVSVLSTASNNYDISNINMTYIGAGNWYMEITCAAAAHGVAVGDSVVLSGVKLKFSKPFGDKKKISVEGEFTVDTTTGANSFKIIVPLPTSLTTFVQVVTKGLYTAVDSLTGSVYNEDDSAAPLTSRFSCVTSFASRLFYSGCEDYRISNRVYFSKVVEGDLDVGICYQQSDPTSEYISDLIATDGGYITLPEAGAIKALMPFGSSVVVFATNGIWEIGPGESGFFSAIGYSVKKLASIGCLSSTSVVDAGNIPMYWAEDGIYAIMQDPNSGYTTAVNVTKDTINGLYLSIRYAERSRAKGVYDSVRKRVCWLYNSRLVTPITSQAPTTGESMVQTTPVTAVGVIDDTDTNNLLYDSMLLLDARTGAWTRWTFGASGTYQVRDIIAMPSTYLMDNDNRLKIICQGTGASYLICDFNKTDYKDNGAESEAFVYSGPDSIAEPERFKFAPYVHVFSRRIPNNSILMQPRWDWARGTDSGKISNYVEVYRETRPASEAYGLVVTKNKVPGRGRNLFLAFKAGPGAPAWFDGWTIKYDGVSRI